MYTKLDRKQLGKTVRLCQIPVVRFAASAVELQVRWIIALNGFCPIGMEKGPIGVSGRKDTLIWMSFGPFHPSTGSPLSSADLCRIINPQYIYDDADNFILTPYNKVHQYSKKFPILYFLNQQKALTVAVLAKYLPDNTFCWAIGFAEIIQNGLLMDPIGGSFCRRTIIWVSENMDNRLFGLLPDPDSFIAVSFLPPTGYGVAAGVKCCSENSVRVTADKDYAVDSVFAPMHPIAGRYL